MTTDKTGSIVEVPLERNSCRHDGKIRAVTPGGLGCEECIASRDPWVHLRLCRTCGHVGCCDDSLNRHASKHNQQTGHPINEGYGPPEGWGLCYPDKRFIELPDQTPQRGPIPQFF